MKTRESRRQTTKVSHSRWLAYATAGAATALVGSNSAEAAIHYSGLVVEVFPRGQIRPSHCSSMSPVIPLGLDTLIIFGFLASFKGTFQGVYEEQK